jgi:large subunit ribosomal protein L9
MEIILRRTVANLGGPGDVVKVKPGYAHNYLIPMNLAMPKTEENLRRIESEKAELAAYENQLRADAEKIRKAHNDIIIEFDMKSGNEGVLYGSVTAQDIADALKDKGLEVDRKKLIIPQTIKRLGVYDIALRLHPEVDLDFKVIVADNAGVMPEEISKEIELVRNPASAVAEDTSEVVEEAPVVDAAAEATEEIAEVAATEPVEEVAEATEETEEK